MRPPLVPWQEDGETPATYSSMDQLLYFIDKHATGALPTTVPFLPNTLSRFFPAGVVLGLRFHNDAVATVVVQAIVPNQHNESVVVGSRLLHVNDVDVTHLTASALVHLLKLAQDRPRHCLFQLPDPKTPPTLTHSGGAWIYVHGRLDDAPIAHTLAVPINVVDVACGPRHLLLRTRTGLVYSFGSGDCGRLGHGDTSARASPTLVHALRGDVVVGIAAGRDHSICVSQDGAAYAFGWGEGGRLGLGVDAGCVVWPARVVLPPTVKGFHVVAAGRECSVLISLCGRVFMCGLHLRRDAAPELLLAPHDLPLHPPLASDDAIVSAKAGDAHCVVRTAAGFLYSWGDGAAGAVGHGAMTMNDPVRLPGLVHVVKVTCGAWHTACVTRQRQLWVWGDNLASVPTAVAEMDNVQDMACGDDGVVYVKQVHDVAVSAWSPAAQTSKSYVWRPTSPQDVRVEAGGSYAVVLPHGSNPLKRQGRAES
ncbi:Aste57867_12157 [Aphanomyces stellatus]|uniref:Aste57867_12157 protein n=1 Tax=Aphanomyces stellatus TaxID=120398 RepID=A0A485KUS8_9STRA|nr:hypothetical protein As57867_012112 [Aphanomyces stellatus]VFT89011.1 Aste57867_12157 [Aphanomyces stellatus]